LLRVDAPLPPAHRGDLVANEGDQTLPVGLRLPAKEEVTLVDAVDRPIGWKINVDNYGDCWTSGEHMRTSPDFARNPIGTYVDPDKMIAARKAGASPWRLHDRACAGEFAPAQPYDPRVLL
jgi:hypothetical protein